MSREEVVRLAKEAGLSPPQEIVVNDYWTADLADLELFAALVEQAEREACARVCDEVADKHLRSGRYVSVVADHSVRAGGQVDGAEECAAAIRARNADQERAS